MSLDCVEKIPQYVRQTAAVVIALTANLFDSYWCAVELCAAVELHAEGKLDIVLVPVQGERWSEPATGVRLDQPPSCSTVSTSGSPSCRRARG